MPSVDISKIWPSHLEGAYEPDGGADDRMRSGESWSTFLEHLRAAGDMIAGPGGPDAMLDRAEGHQHLLNLLAVGTAYIGAAGDPYKPELRGGVPPRFKVGGQDCPDALMHRATLLGTETYRLHGRVGSAQYMGFQLNSRGRHRAGTHAGEITIEPDGSFELWIGGEPRPSNWLPATPDVDELFTRQFFYDWSASRPASMHIERVSDTKPQAVARQAHVGRQVELLGEWLEAHTRFWFETQAEAMECQPNAFETTDVRHTDIGGDSSCVTPWGQYVLEPGQALLVEVEIPEAQYWSITLGNYWWESLDWVSHQVSLNGHQAVVDGDGIFRAVVSDVDPGVPNWLDTYGHHVGPMCLRWYLPRSPLHEPKCTVVAQDEVLGHLPPSTPRVTPEERAEQLRARRVDALRRFAPPKP